MHTYAYTYTHTHTRCRSTKQRDYNVTFDQSDDMWLFYEAIMYLQNTHGASRSTAHTLSAPQATCRSALVYDDRPSARKQ